MHWTRRGCYDTPHWHLAWYMHKQTNMCNVHDIMHCNTACCPCPALCAFLERKQWPKLVLMFHYSSAVHCSACSGLTIVFKTTRLRLLIRSLRYVVYLFAFSRIFVQICHNGVDSGRNGHPELQEAANDNSIYVWAIPWQAVRNDLKNDQQRWHKIVQVSRCDVSYLVWCELFYCRFPTSWTWEGAGPDFPRNEHFCIDAENIEAASKGKSTAVQEYRWVVARLIEWLANSS